MKIHLLYRAEDARLEETRANLRGALAAAGLARGWTEVDMTMPLATTRWGNKLELPAVLVDGKQAAGTPPTSAAILALLK